MIQWIGVIIALLGFAYNGVKDYQSGNIKLPDLTEKKELTRTNYPVQYCLMAYDPNIDKIFYQHETGIWYEYAPPTTKIQISLLPPLVIRRRRAASFCSAAHAITPAAGSTISSRRTKLRGKPLRRRPAWSRRSKWTVSSGGRFGTAKRTLS